MTRKDFEGVFGHTPQLFVDRLDDTLDRLEGEDDMKKRYKFSTMLLVAVMVMSLIGGSVAIGTGLVSDGAPAMSEPGVLPFVEEPVQLEIAIPQHNLVLNYDDNYMTKKVEAETGERGHHDECENDSARTAERDTRKEEPCDESRHQPRDEYQLDDRP